MKKLVFAQLLFVLSSFCFAGDLTFSDSQWDIGSVPEGIDLSYSLQITNTSGNPVQLDLMSSCDCLMVELQSISLQADESIDIELVYSTEGESGEFRKFIIILSDIPALPKLYFPVIGEVIGKDAPNEVESSAILSFQDLPSDIDLDQLIKVYYSPGCKTCQRLFSTLIPELNAKYNLSLYAAGVNILDDEGYQEYQEQLKTCQVAPMAFPALVFRGQVLQGEREIELHLEEIIQGDYSATTQTEFRELVLGVIPVLLAGLLDGVNPCVFSALLFLLSSLAIAGRSRKQILQIGIFFTLTVFVSYFLIGLGFFSAIRVASVFPIIAMIIRWILATVLVVFSILSFYDYLKIKKGKSEDILLQLPQSLKKRVHKSVRENVRAASVILSAIVMGFFVSIFELACTGQVYFPAIAYMIRMENQISGYLYLLIYNLGFIFPLMIVFFITWKGITSKKITIFFQNRMGAVKMLTAILFIILAVITILI